MGWRLALSRKSSRRDSRVLLAWPSGLRCSEVVGLRGGGERRVFRRATKTARFRVSGSFLSPFSSSRCSRIASSSRHRRSSKGAKARFSRWGEQRQSRMDLGSVAVFSANFSTRRDLPSPGSPLSWTTCPEPSWASRQRSSRCSSSSSRPSKGRTGTCRIASVATGKDQD